MTVRICLTGAESTGKTSLAARLAARRGGVVMPEYGREWAETFGTDFPPQVLVAIAQGHERRRRGLAAAHPALIIEDTDVVTTSAWQIMLHGARSPILDAMPASADAWLLFAPDTAWQDDGTRQFGGSERLRFHAVLAAELARRGITPVPIAGDFAAREAAALAVIDDLLARAPAPAPAPAPERSSRA